MWHDGFQQDPGHLKALPELFNTITDLKYSDFPFYLVIVSVEGNKGIMISSSSTSRDNSVFQLETLVI